MGNMYEMGAIALVRQSSTARPEQLTPRQLEVLALLCEGLPNKLIGRRLNISSATVKIHVANILRTLSVSSRLQAIIAAASLGLNSKSGDGQPVRGESVTAPRQPAVLRLVLDESSPRLLATASNRLLAAAAG